MRHRARSILAVGALLIAGASIAPIAQAQGGSSTKSDPDEVKVFHADVTQQQIPLLLKAGQDAHELGDNQFSASGRTSVEVYLTDRQAQKLEKQGVGLTEHTLTAKAETRVEDAAQGVFRPYSGSGGLKEEIVKTGQANPGLTKVESIGKTVDGQDILALKLTKGAKTTKDGSKPSVLYVSNQHAREWITPEMTRRLMHYYLDNYKTDKRIKKLVDSTELWFVLSANPDGYDYTFQNSDTRLWRKNLRDVNGDGTISTGDGVDLNRNFAYKWGYDDEGSSRTPPVRPTGARAPTRSRRPPRSTPSRSGSASPTASITTPPPNSSSTGSAGRSRPHPGRRPLQGARRHPDNPAIPGYHSQVSSELYTTNGEADGHASNVNSMSMFTPRCRPVRPRRTSTRTTPGTRPTASPSSTSPTTRS